MSKRIRKPINPFGHDLNDGIIRITALDFENDADCLLKRVLKHTVTAGCKNCQWIVLISEKTKTEENLIENKKCVLQIQTDANLIGKALDKLEKNHGFKRIIDYNPEEAIMSAHMYIYCEPLR